MKKIAVLCLTIALFGLRLQAQIWTALNNSGTTEHLISIHFIDDNTGFVVGYNGVILKTSDGGASWIPQASGTTNRFYSTYFTDALNGWAVGDAGAIVHTTNGGASWNPVFSPAGTDDLRVVWFLNPNIGFIAGGLSGSTATMIKTIDGGATWTDISPSTQQAIYGIFFTSPLIGYASDFNGRILKTTNGGASWNAQTVSTNNLHGIFFTDANTGYVAGGTIATNSGVILKTTDAGNTWSPYNVPQGFLTDIKFLGSNTGVAVGGHVSNNVGLILRTTDAGATWTQDATNPAAVSRQFRVFLPSAQTWYSCGLDGTILKLSDTTPMEQACDVKVNGCVKYELLSITKDAGQNHTYRIRVTNNCANKLCYFAVQVPNGVQATDPLNNATFLSDGGKPYLVRNPNFSPFYSVRFSPSLDSIANSQSDIFEYTLPAPAANPTFIHVLVRLAPQIYNEAHLNTFYCEIGQTPVAPKPAAGSNMAPLTISLHPNPSSGLFAIELSEPLTPDMRFRILSPAGQVLLEKQGETGSKRQTIDAGLLPQGLYFLQVVSEGKVIAVEKFVKQ